MEKFTKGPWIADHDSIYTTATTEDGGDVICLSPSYGGLEESASHWNDNSKLLKAAPDLYEALQEVLKYPSGQYCDGYEEACTKARAALSKATA